jgi:hypothetical protein
MVQDELEAVSEKVKGKLYNGRQNHERISP